jgi:hypothetical protein
MVDALRKHFKDAGHELAANIKVSVGWPSKGGLSRKRPVIGQCFYEANSAAGNFEIFISPVTGDAVEAAAILVHELAHTCLPVGTKHNKTFAALAHKLGLEGKATATTAGDDLVALLKRIIDTLGPYPHAKLSALTPLKKQTTRQRKTTCKQCGYVVRVTAKWLQVGAPICPVDDHGPMVADEQGGADGSDDED